MSTHDSKNGLSNRGRPRLEVSPRFKKTDFQTEDVLVWRSVLGSMERNLSFVLGLHPIHTHACVNNNASVSASLSTHTYVHVCTRVLYVLPSEVPSVFASLNYLTPANKDASVSLRLCHSDTHVYMPTIMIMIMMRKFQLENGHRTDSVRTSLI
jgi:hypothetical protein